MAGERDNHPGSNGASPGAGLDDERARALRRAMVDEQLRGRDIMDPAVLEAMERVPRHQFVPPNLRHEAYADGPLPIGHGQTISQPYIVALMTQLARPGPGMRALDVGTGCGYQAAVLAELCDEVFSVEVVPELAEVAQERLHRLGYRNVTVRCGDGRRGLPDDAPFDLIVVAAAPVAVPRPLVEQLARGARMVIPVGVRRQILTVVTRGADGGVETTPVAAVRFVPLTGEGEL